MFALGQARYAVELRWVREVFTAGHVTPVPHAPDAVAGVVNYRGAVMPLLDLDAVLGRRSGVQPARAGESALLIEVEEVTAALRVSSVVEVATLKPAPGGDPELLVDSTGRQVPLVNPPELLARARQAASAAAGALAVALSQPQGGQH